MLVPPPKRALSDVEAGEKITVDRLGQGAAGIVHRMKHLDRKLNTTDENGGHGRFNAAVNGGSRFRYWPGK